MKYIDSSPSVAFLHLSLVCSLYRSILISITVLQSIYQHIFKRKKLFPVSKHTHTPTYTHTHTHTHIHTHTHTHTHTRVKPFLVYPEGTSVYFLS